MKNSLFTNSDGTFKLLSSVNDGTTALYINGTAIDSTYWVGSGTYTYVNGSHTYSIEKAASASGNWQLIQDDEYNYHFAKVKDKTAELLDLFYPVGSYYETSDTSFDPNVTWGGTWELETGGLVHIGAGSGYTAGDTGGEATHTLTIDEMPAHNHDFARGGSSLNIGTTGAETTNGFASGSLWSGSNKYRSAIASKGGGGSHNNMQPYLVVNRWHRSA